MELEPLPAGDLEELIRQRLGVKTLPAQVTELVRRKAEGNPFFSEELVFALRDAALIRITGDRCEIAPNVDLDAVAFPDTVQEVVTSRIDRLTPAQQLTLKVASVIGRAIIFHLLSDTFPVDSDRPLLHAQLESLSRLDFTVLDTPEPELVYIFKHVITQEVSYSLLLFAQRRELHRHVAEWYERMYASDLSPYYALLAHHWTKAEVPAKAMEYLEQAGGQALRNFANNEAFAAFEEALKIAADPALAIAPVRRARWELLAGEACVNLSKYVEGRRHIEAGLALAGQPVPQGAAGQGAFVLVQLLRQLKHRSLGARTLSSPEERSARLELTRAYERLAEATYFQGETLLPVYSALRGLNLAETTGPTPEQGRSAAAVGAILGFIPMHGVATSYLDRALKIAEASEHLESREYVSMTASYYYSGVGNWGQVTERADEVLALARRMGDVRRWQDVTSHKLAMLDFRGEYAAAIQLAEELEAVARRRQDVRFMALALQGKAYAQLYLGKLEEAISTLRAIDALVSGGDQVTVLPIKMELLGMLAIASLRSGDVDAALQNAAQTLALTARAMPSFYAALSGYTGPVDVYLTVKEQNFPLPDLSMQTQRACKALAKYAQVFSIGVPGSLLQRGRYDWLANKPGAAFKAWQECLERAQALEMPLEQGRAHYELARRLPPNDPAQAEHRAQAIELFTRLNAAYDLARAHAL
jgi:tetratricopeptide (TPR) repeat protein